MWFMLKIRLQRVGRKHDPSFRVVVTDSHNAANRGRYVEKVGSHNARFGKPELNAERITYWISVGAQVSPTVHNLLLDAKIISGKKINVLPKKTPIAKEKTEGEEKANEQMTEKTESPQKEAETSAPESVLQEEEITESEKKEELPPEETSGEKSTVKEKEKPIPSSAEVSDKKSEIKGEKKSGEGEQKKD